MQEKAFSRFSSRYSSGNPRCTAYICTTVISWASCPRNNSRTSTARNWSASGKIPRKFLPNTPSFTTTSSRLCRQSWTTARACPGGWKPLPRSGRKLVKQMRRKDAPPELADRRARLTCKIAELRKEDKIAEGAIKRIQRTRESNRIDRENRMPLHPRPRRRRRERERE